MERKRHLRLVNGLSRVFGNSDKGKAQAKGRADAIRRITLSCYPDYPMFPWPNFSFLKNKGAENRTIEVDEKADQEKKGGSGVQAA